MITTLLSLYLSGTILNSDIPKPQSFIWNDNIAQVETLPDFDTKHRSPVLNAKSILAVDLDTGLTLYEKNIDERVPMASLTKLMTTLIVLDEKNIDLEKVLTVSKKASQIEGSKIWLPEGEKITIKKLLQAALIHSANDAAYALAENDPNGFSGFIKKMNEKSKTLGLFNTNFTNPVGLDEKDHFSTARDLAVLAHYAYENDFIRETVQLKQLEVTSENQVHNYKLQTTNELLYSYFKVLGLKTGTTEEAGECLITVVENEEGHKILTVMLNSPARFKETKLLADWIFRSYKWT